MYNTAWVLSENRSGLKTKKIIIEIIHKTIQIILYKHAATHFSHLRGWKMQFATKIPTVIEENDSSIIYFDNI